MQLPPLSYFKMIKIPRNNFCLSNWLILPKSLTFPSNFIKPLRTPTLLTPAEGEVPQLKFSSTLRSCVYFEFVDSSRKFLKMLVPLSRLFVCLCLCSLVRGHGRLMDPPARNSMWRFGFPNPVNYNDNELFCGGYAGEYLNRDVKNRKRCYFRTSFVNS